jgi:hypothetical protein
MLGRNATHHFEVGNLMISSLSEKAGFAIHTTWQTGLCNALSGTELWFFQCSVLCFHQKVVF